MDLTAQVGAVLGTSALLYYITAPRRQASYDHPLHLTKPWEEESTLARTRRFRDTFQKKKSHSSGEYSSFRRKTSSTMDDHDTQNRMTSSDGSVTSQQSGRSGSSMEQ